MHATFVTNSFSKIHFTEQIIKMDSKLRDSRSVESYNKDQEFNRDLTINEHEEEINPDLHKIIIAALTGSVIEWYDFFLFGILGGDLASKFYRTGSPEGNTIAFLATFATGMIIRPLGSVLFGYLGDVYGRKITFALSLLMMGVGTVLVGCMPTIDLIGPASGYILFLLRAIQGLAVGGEYGGAVVYIAESCPQKYRGFYTGINQSAPSIATVFSYSIILLVKIPMGESKFSEWGWRIPFLLSIVMLAISAYIRSKLRGNYFAYNLIFIESPAFLKLKESKERTSSKTSNPLKDVFTSKSNLYLIFIALFGCVWGQACVCTASHYFALVFLQSYSKVPTTDTYIIFGVASLIGSVGSFITGWLSDRIGRKPLMIAGFSLALGKFFHHYSVLRPNVYGICKIWIHD